MMLYWADGDGSRLSFALRHFTMWRNKLTNREQAAAEALPLMSRSRRSLSRSPPGSFWVGGRICIPRRCANRSLSETAGTLPGSAISCPVSRRCLEPCRRRWLRSCGGAEPLGFRRRRRGSSEEALQRSNGKKKENPQQLKLMEHVAVNDLPQVSG